jgi:hypothetical protein
VTQLCDFSIPYLQGTWPSINHRLSKTQLCSTAPFTHSPLSLSLKLSLALSLKLGLKLSLKLSTFPESLGLG